MSDLIDKAETARYWLHELGINELLSEDGVTEVMVNRPGEIWVKSSNGLLKHNKKELTFQNCQALALALATLNDKKIDLKKPSDSVNLPDGQRGHVILSPAAEKNTVVFSIRKPSSSRFKLTEYQASGRLNNFIDVSDTLIKSSLKTDNPNEIHLEEWQKELIAHKENRHLVDFFQLAIKYKLNICMVGGTGSGKTTFTKDLGIKLRLNIKYKSIYKIKNTTNSLRITHLVYSIFSSLS